jgi:hypothetical protein
VEQLLGTLRLLSTFGADPHARVGKLLSARQREERKRLALLELDEAGLQRNKSDAQRVPAAGAAIEKDKTLLKKRAEVLKVRQIRPEEKTGREPKSKEAKGKRKKP